MTDQDNLRDRITQVFYQVGNGALVLSMSPNERNDLAQAIIDELGLTVETRIDEPGKRGINPVSRIVGKWEEK